MKTFIIIFICLCFAKVQAQTFTKYADTANYLIHQIENKKSLFVNKPLSVLLDSLKIQPVHAINSSSRSESDFGKSIRIYFNYEREYNKKHIIILDFNNVPSYTQLFPVFYPNAGGLGSIQSIINVYKTLIVKNVLVKDYTDDEPVNPNVHY